MQDAKATLRAAIRGVKGIDESGAGRRCNGQGQGFRDLSVSKLDQKDFSVLNYLSIISSEGPSPAIVEVTHEITGHEQYKEAFQQLKENGFVDEDNSEDPDNDTWGDDDESDLDYEDPKPVVSDQEMQVVEAALRSRIVEKDVLFEGFSSPPSSLYAEGVYSQKYLQDAVNEFMSAAVDV
ncbi:hypothetical protein BGZ54_007116 [Gamsiella multidivaricata]|nr:hypothetical protein BGZ54_007116 [Gamsiella multidivaricata]